MLTNNFYYDKFILVHERKRKKSIKTFEKKLLTKKNGFDKMKKLKQAKNFEN